MVQCSEDNFGLYEVDPEIFLRIIIGDEMWIHCGNPETEQSPCNGNMIVHPLPRNSEHHCLLERSSLWLFGIWMEFWLWTTSDKRQQSLGMHMLLCFRI
jgi:hypothetical protein